MATIRKLILKNGLSPGDIVMLTAAVRDLHRCYPGRFLTDVRTTCSELWENNSHITPLSEKDSTVEVLDCEYPLIDRCNTTPYHCLHGFIEFLNDKLRLSIKPTAFKGDIHLSAQEKAWYSQVHELTGEDTPFWIIAAGGKYDVTIKWWETRRYQSVVDHFRGKILFVQVGVQGHHHPRLEGVIDLRGQTNLRELVRLVYHSQGVLCPVTAIMHLAAAVEFKGAPQRNRPCVVVAGGREPAYWEAYPDHQFIHTNGALPCCSNGGCWRDRTTPLGDGDARDQPEHLCINVAGKLPRCMDMIAPAEVIRRIELYFDAGILQHLAPRQFRAAKRGIAAGAGNPFDQQSLTLPNARFACEQFIRQMPAGQGNGRGRGIVICGGGLRYFTNAWVCINMLRRLGCSLPIELWHLGKGEMDVRMKSLVAPLDVECVDAAKARRKWPARRLGGWELKPYAMLHSRFREVLFLDADNVPVVNPEFLFATPDYRKTGAIFWPDYGHDPKANAVWQSCDVPRPEGPEFESGQIVLDKKRCWKALRLCLWFNEHSDFYYQYLHGDKETFHLAFRKMEKSFSFVKTPIHTLAGTMCQHDFSGRRIFQHRNTDKWNLHLRNKRVADFWFEDECREYVRQLQGKWDGRMGVYRSRQRTKPRSFAITGRRRKPVRIGAWMISCAERASLRQMTLRNLAATDWDHGAVSIQMDKAQLANRQARQERTTFLALKRALRCDADYILFLEDDLDFNRFLLHNLLKWEPLQSRQVTLAGLYNPSVRELACDVKNHAIVADPHSIFGSQAFLISLPTARYLVQHWDEVEGMQDIKMSRLSARLDRPIYYHVPSLVQHIGRRSVWGGGFHQAVDFAPLWKA